MEFTKPCLRYFPAKTDEQKEKEKQLYKRYEDIALTLPCHNGLPFITFLKYKGFWYAKNYINGVIAFQNHFKALPSDIILTSYPRSGTTWFKSLIFSIITRKTNDPRSSSHPLRSLNPHEIAPAIEFLYASTNLQFPDLSSQMQPPRFYSTHVAYTDLPDSIKRSPCKIIHVARNPKANVVSLWRFTLGSRQAPEEVSPLKDTVELYADGVSTYGPVWDNVGGYWKESVEHPEKVLFLKYEEVEMDSINNLRRLATFLGFPFAAKEEKRGLPGDIVKLCSFDSLSELDVNSKAGMDLGSLVVENTAFFSKKVNRKLVNQLTPEMERRLETVGEKMEAAYGLKLWR